MIPIRHGNRQLELQHQDLSNDRSKRPSQAFYPFSIELGRNDPNVMPTPFEFFPQRQTRVQVAKRTQRNESHGLTIFQQWTQSRRPEPDYMVSMPRLWPNPSLCQIFASAPLVANDSPNRSMKSRNPRLWSPPQPSDSATSGPIFAPTPPTRKSITGSRPGREPCGIDAIRGGLAS